MNEAQVIELLNKAFEQAEITVQIEGSHYHVNIVASEFEGARAVKRQQMVYAALAAPIASGEIHAVHMNLAAPGEG